MEINAKAPRKGTLSEHCRFLSVKTDDPEQQAFLAALYAVAVDGGSVTVKHKRRGVARMTFAGIKWLSKSLCTK